MPSRWTQAPLLDAASACALALVGLTSLAAGADGARAADVPGVLLVVLGAAAVAVRQWLPLTVLAVTLGTSLAVLQLDYHQSGGGLTVLWALHAVASRTPLRLAGAAGVAAIGLVHVVLTTAPGTPAAADRLSTTVVLGAGWALGLASRWRRGRFEALEARADAERAAHEAEKRAAVAEDRATIARDMQDLVAHDLAEMTVQVVAARRVVRQDPVAAEELLSSAEQAARGVVGEVRRILELLAGPDGPEPAGGATSRRPLPGLDDLEELVARHRAEGWSVSLVRTSPEDVAATAPGPGLLAYRLVEEALADARGRGAREATVDVDRTAPALRVVVRDDGDRRDALPQLEALRRRAELYGGRVEQGVGAPGTVVLEVPVTATRRDR